MKTGNTTKPPEGERDRNAKKMVSVNRRARHEYEILDTYEAGMFWLAPR